MTGDESIEARAAEQWERADADSVIVERDKAMVRECQSLRTLVLREAFAQHPKELELACGRFGHFLGSHGATPTLAFRSAETLGMVWSDACGGERELRRARAAIVEGYVFARTAEERDAAARAWEPADTVVFVDEKTATVAASPPFEDGEVRSAWADRVAAYLTRAGIRRAVVSGKEPAVMALESACRIAGIDFVRASQRTK